MLYQLVRKYHCKGVTDYDAICVGTYQQLIDWCAGANLHCQEHRLPFTFEMFKLPGLELELAAMEV